MKPSAVVCRFGSSALAPRAGSTALLLSAAAALLVVLPAGCSSSPDPFAPHPEEENSTAAIRFTDVSDDVGIRFVHHDGSSGRRYIVEPMSAGLALFDYDGDGWTDIYFLNGAPLPGCSVEVPPRNALYRNLGGWQFQDVTAEAGVGDTGFGLGVTVGDYDSDGDPDLYLNNYGPNVLYRNNGDGTFSDVTDQAGVGNGGLVGAGASFLDMDADGDLDLYVANYLDFDPDTHVPRRLDGIPSYPSPKEYEGVPDTLFRNEGDGMFTDVSSESGVAQTSGTGMGMVCADYDRDGDADIFVLNDVDENFFWENDGTGHFREVGIINGVAYDWSGDTNASMGVDCGDVDNDGWLDFIMTSYQGESPALYLNLGIKSMEDASQISGIGTPAFPYVNWGVGMVDFDNDGHRDIYIANGHTEDNIETRDKTGSYRARNLLLRNQGNKTFQNVTETAGSGMLPIHASRGAGFDDLDNDGDVDFVVLNSRERPTIARNDSPRAHHWLQLQLHGVPSNRDAVGAAVTVIAAGRSWVDEVHSGRGYQSHFGTRLHFGLGTAQKVETLEIRWPDGRIQSLQDVPADRLLRIVESKAP